VDNWCDSFGAEAYQHGHDFSQRITDDKDLNGFGWHEERDIAFQMGRECHGAGTACRFDDLLFENRRLTDALR
jgi:hypothetical protein